MTAVKERAALHRAALFFFLLPALCLHAQSPALLEKSERAQLWMAQGRYAEAAQLYEELSRALPGNPGLLMNLGMARQMAGRDADSIAPLEAALRLPGAPPPARLFLGAAYLRTGQPAKAVAPLERFLAVDPNHREARQMLADAAAATGQPAKAAAQIAQLAEWDPANPAVWYTLGRTWEAVADEHMSKLPPDSGYWLALTAEGRNKRRQNRAGFLLYRKALEKLPRLRGLHAALAEIYRETGHPDWAQSEQAAEAALGQPVCKPTPGLECHFAAAQYRRVLASPAITPEARYWKSRAATALAREAFAKLTALGPSVAFHRWEAETRRDEGRHPDAVAAWRAALALAPADHALQFELASALVQTKELDAAQELVTALLAADPAAPDFNHLQGEIHLSRQEPEPALPFLAKAAQAEPQALPVRASYGRALMLAGRAADAIPHLEAALPLDVDGSLHFQLSRACQAAGQPERARQLAEKSQLMRQREEEDRRRIEVESEITPPK